MAVGRSDNEGKQVTLGEQWNGTEWSTQTPPNPTGATYTWLEGVSCVSSSECVTVGTRDSSGKAVTLGEIFR